MKQALGRTPGSISRHDMIRRLNEVEQIPSDGGEGKSSSLRKWSSNGSSVVTYSKRVPNASQSRL